MDVEPKIGGFYNFTPKVDGENNGSKPYEQMDDLGVALFLETPRYSPFQVLYSGISVRLFGGREGDSFFKFTFPPKPTLFGHHVQLGVRRDLTLSCGKLCFKQGTKKGVALLENDSFRINADIKKYNLYGCFQE